MKEVGVIEDAQYPEWIANVVPVAKKDGRVRVCVDFRDLNQASPKDKFAPPHIDLVVDNSALFNQYSFMDGYAGYHQIRLAA